MIFFVEALGFKHEKDNGDHVVSGHGFSKRHVSMTCIVNRIADHIAALANNKTPSVIHNPSCDQPGSDKWLEEIKRECVEAHPAEKMEYAGKDFEEITSLIIDHLAPRLLRTTPDPALTAVYRVIREMAEALELAEKGLAQYREQFTPEQHVLGAPEFTVRRVLYDPETAAMIEAAQKERGRG
jgi:hypothetical protein